MMHDDNWIGSPRRYRETRGERVRRIVADILAAVFVLSVLCAGAYMLGHR